MDGNRRDDLKGGIMKQFLQLTDEQAGLYIADPMEISRVLRHPDDRVTILVFNDGGMDRVMETVEEVLGKIVEADPESHLTSP